MATDSTEFVKNYNDLSTDQGFRFEFICDHCGSGHRTNFQASATGTASSVLGVASSFLGGFFGKAADVTEKVKSASWQKAWDKAFEKAQQEIKPLFIQCPRCNKWVCRKKCWNEKKGLCKACAPDLGVEMAAAQASKSVEEVWAHAAMAEEDKKLGEENWRAGVKASCPKCEAPVKNVAAKFCQECGASLASDSCPKCKEKLNPGDRFCGSCGEKIG